MDTFSSGHRGGSGSPLVCLHGFIDNWRTWDLVRDALEAEHDVLATALPGHAGGPVLEAPASVNHVLDLLEDELDEQGIETAHLVGNSLGGYLALRLAARGRARSVVVFAPAGGWAPDDAGDAEAVTTLEAVHDAVVKVVQHADAMVASPEGRRQATALITTHYEHIPAELLAHQIRGIAAAEGAATLIEAARRESWGHVDAAAISCPLRFVWGTEDQVLPWPRAAAVYRRDFPHADWVELEGVGHCPQLDVPAQAAELVLGFTGE